MIIILTLNSPNLNPFYEQASNDNCEPAPCFVKIKSDLVKDYQKQVQKLNLKEIKPS